MLLNFFRIDNTNFKYLNIDEKTEIISVVNGKIKNISSLDISMKNILDVIAAQEGSYSKACEVCKSINVLSDENLSPDLESVIEPAIQDLLNRINRKIIIQKSQLRKETVKVEKTEAFGMDFSGKIHVIENAISAKKLIEITYESSNSPEGKNVIIGLPLLLTRESSDTFVDVIIEPEKTQKTLSLANAISIKKLRGSILN